MPTTEDHRKAAEGIIAKRGGKTLQMAKAEIQKTPKAVAQISAALRYFSNTTHSHTSPLFPALMSLSCEAAGGEPSKIEPIGASLMLIAAAADIHDDIIDKSTEKYGKKTVVGQFGESIAVLSGDALLMEGLMLLHKECSKLPQQIQQNVLSLVAEVFFKTTNGQAKEILLTAAKCKDPKKYLEILRFKAAVPGLFCRVGALIGGANPQFVNCLGDFGESLGFVGLVLDEFVDLFDTPELVGRIRSGDDPIPLMYALHDGQTKDTLEEAIRKTTLQDEDLERIVQIVLSSKDVNKLRKLVMRTLEQQAEILKELPFRKSEERTEAELLLQSFSEWQDVLLTPTA
jgi:geranylgeranyl pyrophosphate synthase